MILDWHRLQMTNRSLTVAAPIRAATVRERVQTLLLQRRRPPRAAIQAIEEQLEGGVRLVAEIDFRTEQEHLALADGRFGEDGAPIEGLLAPRPPAVQRSEEHT